MSIARCPHGDTNPGLDLERVRSRRKYELVCDCNTSEPLDRYREKIMDEVFKGYGLGLIFKSQPIV